jgi:hypothetical protein
VSGCGRAGAEQHDHIVAIGFRQGHPFFKLRHIAYLGRVDRCAAHYSITLPSEAIRQLFQTHGDLPNWPVYYNAPPTTALPVVPQANSPWTKANGPLRISVLGDDDFLVIDGEALSALDKVWNKLVDMRVIKDQPAT